jgi:hypothetical protein
MLCKSPLGRKPKVPDKRPDKRPKLRRGSAASCFKSPENLNLPESRSARGDDTLGDDPGDDCLVLCAGVEPSVPKAGRFDFLAAESRFNGDVGLLLPRPGEEPAIEKLVQIIQVRTYKYHVGKCHMIFSTFKKRISIFPTWRYPWQQS